MSMVSRIRSACVWSAEFCDGRPFSAEQHAFNVAETLYELQERAHRKALTAFVAEQTTTAPPDTVAPGGAQ